MTLDSIGNQGVRQDAGRIPNGEVDESFDGSFQAPSSIPGYRYELLNFFCCDVAIFGGMWNCTIMLIAGCNMVS
jgi:hypothetical protein